MIEHAQRMAPAAVPAAQGPPVQQQQQQQRQQIYQQQGYSKYPAQAYAGQQYQQSYPQQLYQPQQRYQTYQAPGAAGAAVDDPVANDPLSATQKAPSTRAAVYVGNFNWWTTDQGLIDTLASIGVKDVTRVNIHVDRHNGKSKGFALIELGSEASASVVMERLPRVEVEAGGSTYFIVALQGEVTLPQFVNMCGQDINELSAREAKVGSLLGSVRLMNSSETKRGNKGMER